MTASDLDISTKRLHEVRNHVPRDDVALAEILVTHASVLLQHVRIGEARAALEEATALHHAAGRTFDEARCLSMTATLSRFGGLLDEAQNRAQQALALVVESGPIAVAAYTELGETALARGDGAASAVAFAAALDAGASAGMGAAARGGLLRKRAVALVNAGQHEAAVRELETAHDIFMEIGDRTSATRTLIEQATTLHYATQPTRSEALIQRVTAQASLAGDHAALADIQLLVAAQAFGRGDAVAALEAAKIAREEALQAVAPNTYFSAAVAISRTANALGDQLEAYRALATAWVMLADVIGNEAAQSWVSPVLDALQTEWGEQRFAAVRAEHDAQRRAAMTNK
ncbi:MAG: hypothetical protein JWM03_329 [Rhodocyclales bacterium]|nr:hypothetical protein [Rhodocyclales bacterium]